MRYLLVDAHSVIFSWPELHDLHRRNGLAAREELTRRLTAYQDASGVRVVVVFDGKGAQSNSETAPGGVQVFYSGGGKTADCIIERLAAKYAGEHEITTATNDHLVQQTVITFGGLAISVEALRAIIDEGDRDVTRRIRRLRR
ncbi:MAG: NYN domain-containing protein [Chthoniobacteraceae bacterium]